MLWQGQADEVQLAAGVQPRLWPVQGAGDLWEASLRIRHLEEAVITIMVLPRRAGDDPAGQVTDRMIWRGTRAPAVLPATERLAGTVTEHTLDSRALVRHYLAAGTLEPGFRRATRQWAQCLQRAGLDYRYHEWVGGHDNLWWEQQLPLALQWLLT